MSDTYETRTIRLKAGGNRTRTLMDTRRTLEALVANGWEIVSEETAGILWWRTSRYHLRRLSR
jgi:uncharacterized protein with von Willebrand factor type A (vWA) domain